MITHRFYSISKNFAPTCVTAWHRAKGVWQYKVEAGIADGQIEYA